MTRSRLVKARAAANERRIATHVVTTTLNGQGRKFQRALKAVQHNNGSKPYMVMVDSQGVGYLRVAERHYLVNTGSKIEVVEMDSSTVRSRALKAVPEASILDAAKVLAQPLTDGVIISARSKKYLDEILNDKELKVMATATKSVTKKAAGNGKAASTGRVSPTVTLKKMAKDDELPKQAVGILKVLGSFSGKKATVADLVGKLKGKIETSQPLTAIWGFYRARLIKGGFIAVAK